jgi:hypothetical protein
MAAPAHNQFWKARASCGREKLFESPESLWNAACEYFEWIDANPLWEDKAIVQQGVPIPNEVAKMRAMTNQGLCLFLDIDEQTLKNYGTKEGYEDFFGIVKKIKAVIYEQKFTGASAGLLNSNIIARDLGLTDKQSNELTGANGGAVKTESKVEWVIQPVKPINETNT